MKTLNIVLITIVSLCVACVIVGGVYLVHRNTQVSTGNKKYTFYQDDRVYHTNKPQFQANCVILTDVEGAPILCGCFTGINNQTGKIAYE